MAFTEKMGHGYTNSANDVVLLQGVVGGASRCVTKAIRLFNADTVSHTVIFKYVYQGVPYTIVKAAVPPETILVVEDAFVLADENHYLKVIMAEAAVTTQPTWLITYAEVG